MTNSQKLRMMVSLIFLFALLGLLWRELFYSKKNELPSALIGKNLPAFVLPTVLSARDQFTHHDLKGKVSLLNVFATWCDACIKEHTMLMKINEEYHIPIYGIDYKDKKEYVTAMLQTNGNPYTIIGDDVKGDVAIDLGVYGTPETFLISQTGIVLYRHVGPIDQRTWDEIFYPLIKQYNGLG